MTDNKIERAIVCEGENCAWQEETQTGQTFWQFSPDNLTAQEIWHWQNQSLNKLLLTFEFKGETIFYPYYQNLLGLNLTSKINGAEKIEKQIIVDWLKEGENQFNFQIEASSEAELIWNFSHPFWNYLKSQQIKNQTLTYDWLIRIEATDSAKISEENEASADGEINWQTETEVVIETVNNQAENISEENQQTSQSETNSSTNENVNKKEEIIKQISKNADGKIKRETTVVTTPKPQVLGATTTVETKPRKNEEIVLSATISSLLTLLLIFSCFKLKKKKNLNYKKQLKKFFLLQKKELKTNKKVSPFQLPKLLLQKHHKVDAFRQDAQDQID